MATGDTRVGAGPSTTMSSSSKEVEGGGVASGFTCATLWDGVFTEPLAFPSAVEEEEEERSRFDDAAEAESSWGRTD